MKKIYKVSRAMEVLEALSKDPYSALWYVVEDFEVNGHVVSISRSCSFGHVVIDDVYVSIEDFGVVIVGGKEYTPLEYARMKLEEVKA